MDEGLPIAYQVLEDGVPVYSVAGVQVGTVDLPAGGQVVLAKNLFLTGNTILLDHGYGLYTIYAHMSKLRVKKGDVVTVQQTIGLAGMTGRANGPHLHWGAVVHGVKAAFAAGVAAGPAPSNLAAKFPITAAMYWSNVWSGAVIIVLALGALTLGRPHAAA